VATYNYFCSLLFFRWGSLNCCIKSGFIKQKRRDIGKQWKWNLIRGELNWRIKLIEDSERGREESWPCSGEPKDHNLRVSPEESPASFFRTWNKGIRTSSVNSTCGAHFIIEFGEIEMQVQLQFKKIDRHFCEIGCRSDEKESDSIPTAQSLTEQLTVRVMTRTFLT